MLASINKIIKLKEKSIHNYPLFIQEKKHIINLMNNDLYQNFRKNKLFENKGCQVDFSDNSLSRTSNSYKHLPTIISNMNNFPNANSYLSKFNNEKENKFIQIKPKKKLLLIGKYSKFELMNLFKKYKLKSNKEIKNSQSNIFFKKKKKNNSIFYNQNLLVNFGNNNFKLRSNKIKINKSKSMCDFREEVNYNLILSS